MTTIHFFEVDGNIAFNKSEYNGLCDEINCYLTDKRLTDISRCTYEQNIIIAELMNIIGKLKVSSILVIDNNYPCGKLTLASLKLLLQDLKVVDIVLTNLFNE